MTSRPAEEMRPGEIVAARDRSGCAFVPVSPAFEWHSFHLPMGTDALISAGLCRAVAKRVGGIWMRPLSFGLDEWRPEEQLLAWGFRADDRVYGMNFPELPLRSEYCEPDEMAAPVRNRVRALQGSGFRHVFLVSHHGGTGQVPVLTELAEDLTTDECRVHFVNTGRFSQVGHESLRVGGHAGLSETTWLMAFRPELVDMSQQEDGELNVRTTGILHGSPTVEAESNPRHASLAVAQAVRDSVVAGFEAYVRQCAGTP